VERELENLETLGSKKASNALEIKSRDNCSQSSMIIRTNTPWTLWKITDGGT